jgi:hypothetical protein
LPNNASHSELLHLAPKLVTGAGKRREDAKET